MTMLTSVALTKRRSHRVQQAQERRDTEGAIDLNKIAGRAHAVNASCCRRYTGRLAIEAGMCIG